MFIWPKAALLFLSEKVHGGQSHTKLSTAAVPGSAGAASSPAGRALLIPRTEEAAGVAQRSGPGGELELQPRPPPPPASSSPACCGRLKGRGALEPEGPG